MLIHFSGTGSVLCIVPNINPSSIQRFIEDSDWIPQQSEHNPAVTYHWDMEYTYCRRDAAIA